MLRPEPRPSLAVERHHHHRAPAALDQARGDDPDHARVPALAGEHVRLPLAELAPSGLRPGGGSRARPARRSRLAESSSCATWRARAGSSVSSSSSAGVGAVQAPGRVQPRRQCERHRPLSGPPRRDAGDLHQARSPGRVVDSRRRRPRTASVRFSPSSGTTSAIVASATRSSSASSSAGSRPRAGVQRLRELVGDGRGTQVAAGVVAHAGVHDRGPRQHPVRARRVVVADHDLEAQRERGLDLLHRGHAAVHAHQQRGPARGEALDRGPVEPVAVAGAVGQVPVHVGTEAPQRRHHHGRRADPVDVVVAVHRDPPALVDVARDARHRRPDPLEQAGVVLLARHPGRPVPGPARRGRGARASARAGR